MKRHLVALLLITALVIPIPIGAQAPSQDLAIQAVVDKILQDGRNINRAALQTRSGAAAHLRRVAANVRALAAVTNFDHQAAMMGRDRLIAIGLRADVVDRLLSGGIESVASELDRISARVSASASAPVAPTVRPAVFILGDTPVIRRVQGIYNQAQCQTFATQIASITAAAAILCLIPGGQIACAGAAANLLALQILYIQVCQ